MSTAPLPESSSITGEDAPRPSGSWPSLKVRRWLWIAYTLAWTAALLVPVPFKEPPLPGFDSGISFGKVMHVLAYAVFAVVCLLLDLPRQFRWLAVLFLVGHAMLTEYLQMVLHDWSHRTGKWSDVGLDCIGVLLGLVLTWRHWLGRDHS
jgi:VanZ family protein